MRGRILIIEDRVEVSRALALILRGGGYLTIAVENSTEALALLHRQSAAVDAIVTDLVLPDSHGVEVVQRLRSHFPHLPLIVLTGHPEFERARWFDEQGVRQYLIKPVRADLLLQVIGEAVQPTMPQGQPAAAVAGIRNLWQRPDDRARPLSP